MRIAITNWSRRLVGGVENYLESVIPWLVQAGHDVAFWHEVDAPTDRDPIGCPVAVPRVCIADAGEAEALAALRAWHPDLVYVHGLLDPHLESQVLEIAPSVFFVHAYYGMCISGAKTFTRPNVSPCSRVFGWPCLIHYFPHGCGGRSPVTMFREYQRQSQRLALLRRYDAIVTHTGHMRAELAKHGLAATQVIFPVRGSTAPHRSSLDGPWRLLFVGRMDRLKGGRVLLDALSVVRTRSDHPVHLTLAGDGPERGRWEQQAACLMHGTEGVQVTFTGWVAQAGLDRLMDEADLLVVPSLWPEPFGASGPGAGKRGLPAAAFAVGGISDWLVDGVSGCLAPGNPATAGGLADAIVKCLADPVVYARLQAGAAEVARRFSMDAHLGSLLEIFSAVCARARARRLNATVITKVGT